MYRATMEACNSPEVGWTAGEEEEEEEGKTVGGMDGWCYIPFCTQGKMATIDTAMLSTRMETRKKMLRPQPPLG